MSETPENRQFVKCTFGSGARAYTYHNDGEALAIGDRVNLETKHGFATGEVVELVDETPAYPTRPATKLPPKESAEADNAEG